MIVSTREAGGKTTAERKTTETMAGPETGAPPALPIELAPHPKAPILATNNGQAIFGQVLSLAQSGNFSTSNPEIREMLRQAGFVSLWFFLRVVAAYNGPYDRLTNHLHADVANHYQQFMVPGRWSAFFLPRSAFKSTVITYGANGWELLRDPNLTIAMGSAISDRAYDFMHETQRIFDSNEFFEWLYPEYVPDKGARSWNDKEMTLPNRTRRKVAPSIQILSVGASSQGVHVELLKLDDIVGDAQLTSERSANADMRRITNWFRSNKRTLLDKPSENRIIVVGTRYSIDDPYEQIMESLKGKYGGGWDDVPREAVPDGEWDVYYRQAIEDGRPIFPESLSKDFLTKIRDEDPWNYLTQYLNNPYTTETAELSAYVPGDAKVDYDPIEGDWVVTYIWKALPRSWRLSQCDVVSATDPAATEKSNVSVKSSRSANVVVVMCPDRAAIVVDLSADYVPISTVFEWMFRAYDKWKPRVSSLEQNGPFKMLRSMLLDEQHRRGRYISVVPAKGVGEKDARIRSELEPRLRNGQLFLTEATRGLFMGELVSFPGGTKKDILDATAQGLLLTHVPPDPDDITEEEEEEEMVIANRSRYTGY